MTQHDDSSRKAQAPRVLVVEDDDLLRALTVEYLEDCGFPVLQADTADEAIQLLQTHRQIDVIFSDIQMPGSMNGLGLAQWTTRERPEVKVLLTSGQVLPADVPRWPVLAKPYRLGEVERQLRNLVHFG